jgi:hypothetical protein
MRRGTTIFEVMLSLTDVLEGAKISKLVNAYTRGCTIVAYAET